MRGTRADELFAIAERLADLGCWELRLDAGDGWSWSDGLFRLHGLERGAHDPDLDQFLATVHPADRDRIGALVTQALAHPESVSEHGISSEYRVVHPDGMVRNLRALGRVEAGPDGGALRWYGIAQDVTDQRAAERDLRAHYEVSQALRDWESVDEGGVDLLRRMATALDCPAGALWTRTPRDEIACRAFWHAPDVDLGEFAAATMRLTFRPGETIPGRVFDQAAVWFLPDLSTHPDFKRAAVAKAAGLASALAFPAVDGGGVVAALSFYSFDRRTPSERLERTLAGIGHELGRFLSRRRAQLEPSPLSARELEVLNLAAEGLSGPKIAQRLVVSPSTVKTHFENIYEKLGVSDRGGAVAVGLRMGLIA